MPGRTTQQFIEQEKQRVKTRGHWSVINGKISKEALEGSYAAEKKAASSLSSKSKRTRRKIGRALFKKRPKYVYRWDYRPPGTIAQSGFEVRNAQSSATLKEHVLGTARRAGDGALDTNFVSTGAFGMLNPIDPTLASRILNQYLYVIAMGDNFIDVNDYFDQIGIDRPYASQREYASEGDIASNLVLGYMTGSDFINKYYDMNSGKESKNSDGKTIARGRVTVNEDSFVSAFTPMPIV